jgi:hypothetical protein
MRMMMLDALDRGERAGEQGEKKEVGGRRETWLLIDGASRE